MESLTFAAKNMYAEQEVLCNYAWFLSNRVTADYGNFCEEFTLCLHPETLDNKGRPPQALPEVHVQAPPGGSRREQRGATHS